LFLSDTGVMALPMTVDPLIMYYNKALISSSFILDIPQYWDELSSFAPQVTQYSGTGEVSISATALGTYDNVPHAKSLIATLMMQNGMNIVGTNTSNNSKRSILTLDDELLQKTVQAVDFYTSFASFGSNTYSWNEALVNAQNKFIAGEVGLYFGRASEVDNIRRKNPNLDFGVQLLPQVRGNTTRLTHGAMMGVAISKQTTNPTAAINVASKLAGQIVTEGLANDMLSAPTRKDLLRDKPDDALRTLVYNSAIISAGCVDTDPVKTNELFRSMIRNINTGAVSTRDALARMNADLNTILDQTINQDIGQNN